MCYETYDYAGVKHATCYDVSEVHADTFVVDLDYQLFVLSFFNLCYRYNNICEENLNLICEYVIVLCTRLYTRTLDTWLFPRA